MKRRRPSKALTTSSPNLHKVLIANRGEIAVRVIRACRELGVRTVAVYSDADELALHVRLADEAYPIGPPSSKESYLEQQKILDAARSAGAKAIHPGYGFLAENPFFAENVEAAGLIFIGPSANAIRLMGDKTAARQLMSRVGVPVVPGTDKPLTDENSVRQAALEIGFPVLLKAAAGGGGKGMRVVESADEIAQCFRAARSEAESAFGDGRVYLEKYLEAPRHIEFQILADSTGEVVHFGERECSIQRRHQKLIEEAPSSILDGPLREKMGQAATQAARACGYRNAGTVEFMLDKNRNFYFLEMNTRLQVEHPVTELVTGIDLVKEQIRIAAGETLGYSQEAICIKGHAIECRINAEDPANGFLPSIGKISQIVAPDGPGVRLDAGYDSGSEVTPYYDSLVAKLITWGRDRQESISRMKRALDELQVHGVQTSLLFLKEVMHNAKFLAGDFDTGFVQKEMAGWMSRELEQEEEIAALSALMFDLEFNHKPQVGLRKTPDRIASRWKTAGRKLGMD